MQIMELEFFPDVGLEVAAPESGVEQVASGAARQRAMGAHWPGLPLRHPHPRPRLTNTPSNSSVPFQPNRGKQERGPGPSLRIARGGTAVIRPHSSMMVSAFL